MIVDIGLVSDFPEGRATLVHVQGRELAVMKWRGRCFATTARCPHMAASFAGGSVTPKLGAPSAGLIEVDRDTPMISCPWHGWQFDLATGCSVWDPSYRIMTYPTERNGDRLLVHLNARARRGTHMTPSRKVPE
jgi:nitrite reductase (NADH) small subunit